MQIVLLSGGSGKRLWPLSNDIRSKQFIQMFRKADGTYESMVQRVYRQITDTIPDVHITVATSKKQVSELRNQLQDKIDICVEPERRDTFPAIVLAAAFLHDIKKVPSEEAVAVCPVDPYVQNTYFAAIQKMCVLAKTGKANLTLLGIEPTFPSEKYGYIIPAAKDETSDVTCFQEKPDLETAKKYLTQGALWNGGVFALQIGYLLNRAKEIIGYSDYEELLAHYGALQKISFDYAVVEHEPKIQVMRYIGEWKDVGSWNTFSEAMTDSIIGNGILDESCRDTNIVNELNLPILCMNCQHMIVAASVDGILVTEKQQSAKIKPYVDKIENQAMYAEKSWGTYTVLDLQRTSMTIKAELKPHQQMSYHSHQYRSEVWTVMAGSGAAVINGATRTLSVGDCVQMPIGCKHTVTAGEQGISLLEVQLGDKITAEDKQKY